MQIFKYFNIAKQVWHNAWNIWIYKYLIIYIFVTLKLQPKDPILN